jgi:hypothetical protein
MRSRAKNIAPKPKFAAASDSPASSGCCIPPAEKRDESVALTGWGQGCLFWQTLEVPESSRCTEIS